MNNLASNLSGLRWLIKNGLVIDQVTDLS